MTRAMGLCFQRTYCVYAVHSNSQKSQNYESIRLSFTKYVRKNKTAAIPIYHALRKSQRSLESFDP